MSASSTRTRVTVPSLFDLTAWRSRALWFVGVLTIMRILAAAGLGLTDTEAYYASWTRVLDWSYYDHPPLLAWLTALSMHFVRGTLGIRLVPIVSSAVFALLLHRFVSKVFSPRAGFFALLVTMAMPAFVFIGFLSNPEAPLAPLWMLSLSLLWEMRERDDAWLPVALGAAVGVGFLSKYTAVLMVPIALVWIASSARRWLARPSLWLGALVALAIASPVIVWNAQHGWPSLALHLSERVAAPSLSTYGANALHTVIGQIGLFQPLAVIALLAALALAVRRRSDPRFRLLAIAGVPVLAFFFVMMVRVRDAEPHWTMMGWLPAAIALAAWLDENLETLSRRVAWYLRAAIAVSVTMLGTSVLHGVSPVFTLALGDRWSDPMGEMLGWETVRAAVESHAASLGPNTVVAASHNVFCGRLAVELRDRPNVYCLSPRRTQFDFVDRRDVPPNAPVVFVESIRYPSDPALVLPDRTCAPLQTLDIERGLPGRGQVVNRYRFHACR